jgi:hypothetical protein
MKKYTLLLLSLGLVITGAFVIFSLFSPKGQLCSTKRNICLLEDGSLNINDQSIVIAVETQTQKDWLDQEFEPYLLNSTGTITVIVREETLAFTFLNSTIDVAMLDKQAAGSLYPYLTRFDYEDVNPHLINYASQHLDEINHEGIAFIPTTIDGPLFVMNTTLLSQLGYDVNDVDEYGRLNALSSFEKIMEANESYRGNRPLIGKKRLTSMFPLTLVEPWSLYSFFTGNGWQLYPSDDASQPGLDTPLFLESLTLAQPIFSHQWDLSDQNKQTWRYENELIGGTAPFAVKVPWLNLESISSVTKQTYVVTPMPTINGNQPYTLAQVKGWVFKESASPALKQLVMEKLTSNAFTQLLITEDKEAVMIDPSRVDEFEMSDIQRQKILASQFTLSPPLFALPHYPSVLGFDFYTSGDMLPILNQLKDQTLTPAQAQTQLIKVYDRWVIERTYYETKSNP